MMSVPPPGGKPTKSLIGVCENAAELAQSARENRNVLSIKVIHSKIEIRPKKPSQKEVFFREIMFKITAFCAAGISRKAVKKRP
jgi:hypothetical protein